MINRYCIKQYCGLSLLLSILKGYSLVSKSYSLFLPKLLSILIKYVTTKVIMQVIKTKMKKFWYPSMDCNLPETIPGNIIDAAINPVQMA